MPDEGELEWVRGSDVVMRAPRRDWHGWELRGTGLTYPAYPGDGRYGFDLTECTTPAKMLDWIMQVDGKLWATELCMAGLVARPQRHTGAAGCKQCFTVNLLRPWELGQTRGWATEPISQGLFRVIS